MSSTVIEVTTDELRQMVDNLVEEKLIALFGDPEAGFELRDELKERLLRQSHEIKDGTAKTYSMDEVLAKLDLD